MEVFWRMDYCLVLLVGLFGVVGVADAALTEFFKNSKIYISPEVGREDWLPLKNAFFVGITATMTFGKSLGVIVSGKSENDLYNALVTELQETTGQDDLPPTVHATNALDNTYNVQHKGDTLKAVKGDPTFESGVVVCVLKLLRGDATDTQQLLQLALSALWDSDTVSFDPPIADFPQAAAERIKLTADPNTLSVKFVGKSNIAYKIKQGGNSFSQLLDLVTMVVRALKGVSLDFTLEFPAARFLGNAKGPNMVVLTPTDSLPIGRYIKQNINSEISAHRLLVYSMGMKNNKSANIIILDTSLNRRRRVCDVVEISKLKKGRSVRCNGDSLTFARTPTLRNVEGAERAKHVEVAYQKFYEMNLNELAAVHEKRHSGSTAKVVCQSILALLLANNVRVYNYEEGLNPPDLEFNKGMSEMRSGISVNQEPWNKITRNQPVPRKTDSIAVYVLPSTSMNIITASFVPGWWHALVIEDPAKVALFRLLQQFVLVEGLYEFVGFAPELYSVEVLDNASLIVHMPKSATTVVVPVLAISSLRNN